MGESKVFSVQATNSVNEQDSDTSSWKARQVPVPHFWEKAHLSLCPYTIKDKHVETNEETLGENRLFMNPIKIAVQEKAPFRYL